MTDLPVSELFALVAHWLDISGNIPDLSVDLVEAETEEVMIKFNRGQEVIGNLKHGDMLLESKKSFLGIAVLNPFGGGAIEGFEQDMIEHFKQLIAEYKQREE